MSDEVTVRAPAKVNLSLAVGNLRDDGYHSLVTVYQAIGMYDEVTARLDEDWSVSVRDAGGGPVPGVPTGVGNLALRAARLLADHAGLADIAGPVHLAVTKAIPVAGGMAGGSADAAAALVACDVLWSTRTPPEVLRRMAATLGSDVPFALVGGSALGTGRGEEVTPIPAAGGFWWVVVESGRGLSTPAVYRELDRMRPAPQPEQPPAPEALIAALESGDALTLGAALSNDLQPAALRLRPDLAEVLAMGPELAALGTVLSGSGPTCLFLADSESSAVRMAARLGDMGLGPVTVAPGPVPGARVRTDLPENSG